MTTLTPSRAQARQSEPALTAVRRKRSRVAFVFIAPFFVLFLVATILPILYALYLSLFQEHASGLGFSGGPTTVFTGLANFVTVVTDATYWQGYLHVAVYAVIAVPLLLVGGIVIALLLDSAFARARRAFQLGIFIPYVVPGIIAALIWLYLYTPQVSPITHFLESFHITINLFGTVWTYPTLANITIWEFLGYNIVLYYASLQAIPRDTIEAAMIDGAGQFRMAVSIKLPLIKATVGLTALFTAIGAMQLFSEPLMLSTGGSSSITQTWTPNLYAYTAAFTKSNYGVAAAASLILAAIAALLSVALTRYAKPQVDE